MDTNNYEVIDTSKRVISKIEKNEYGKISAELTEESMEQLVAGFITVASQISKDMIGTVATIYSQAIISQENLEIKTMNDEAELMRRFNDQIDRFIEKVDLNDSKNVENFIAMCTELRKNLREELAQKHKPSLLDKIKLLKDYENL